jgi:hypothetical protein
MTLVNSFNDIGVVVALILVLSSREIALESL